MPGFGFGYGFGPLVGAGISATPPVTLSATTVPANAPNDTVIGTLSGGSGAYLLPNNAGRQFKIVGNEIRSTGLGTGKGPLTITVWDFQTYTDFELAVDTNPAWPTLAGGVPARGWSFDGAAGSTVAAAFGSTGDLTLVGSPTLSALGPMDQGIAQFSSASSQYGTFPQLDTTATDLEAWIPFALLSLTTGKSLWGRAGAATSQAQVVSGGASLSLRANGGSSVTVALPFTLTLGFHVLQLRYNRTTGFVSGTINGMAITPVSIGTGGFIIDQLGRINTGTYANQWYGDTVFFNRLLSTGDEALVRAYYRQWQSMVYYAAAAGSDSATTPWNTSTPRQTMLSLSTYHSAGDTVALKSGDIFRPAVATSLAAGITYDGGLWGDAYQVGSYGYRYGLATADDVNGADIRFSTAPTLALVSGTIYSFARTNAPLAKVFYVTGDNGSVVTALDYDAGAGATPAVGKCGHAAGLVYVNAGVALTTGQIESSVDAAGDALSLNGANTALIRCRTRFCQETAIRHTHTSGENIADRVYVAWNQGDGHDGAGVGTSRIYGGVSEWNGQTAISGSDGDGYSWHGTATGYFYGCVSNNNFRTCSRHVVSATVYAYGCYHRGRHPFAIVANVATPSAGGTNAYACEFVTVGPNADGSAPYAVFNEYGGGTIRAIGCTMILEGTATDSVAVRAEASGGAAEITDCIMSGYVQGLSAVSGATITESYNRINVSGAARVNVSVGTGSTTGDPDLIDIPGGNYQPAPGSPVIGAGIAAAGNEFANDYVTRPNPPAIGALEPA